MSQKMEVDRQQSEPSDLFSQLQFIINNNELIIQSLKFFAQDVASVQDCEDVISILKALKCKLNGNDNLFQLLEFIFKEIDFKTNCSCSAECISKIHEFLPTSPEEASPSPAAPLAPSSFLPISPIETSPIVLKSIEPEPPFGHLPLSEPLLNDEFVFFKFTDELPIDQLETFAVLGLKIARISYQNLIHQKGTAVEKMRAVLNKWKTEADQSNDPKKMPSYTKSGLIRALKGAQLNGVVPYVMRNC